MNPHSFLLLRESDTTTIMQPCSADADGKLSHEFSFQFVMEKPLDALVAKLVDDRVTFGVIDTDTVCVHPATSSEMMLFVYRWML